MLDLPIPTQEELEQAPILSRWRAENGRLIGFAQKHPNHPDDSYVTTSPVLGIDEEAGWARTQSRIYRLGVSWWESIN